MEAAAPVATEPEGGLKGEARTRVEEAQKVCVDISALFTCTTKQYTCKD